MDKRRFWLNECTAHIPRVDDWTKEKCIESASTYDTPTKWFKGAPGAYCAAKRNEEEHGWFTAATKHMVKPFSTEALCISDAKKYKSKTEWFKKSRAAYAKAKREGWFENCVKQFGEINMSLPECKQDACQYDNEKTWQEKSPVVYAHAVENKWLDNCVTAQFKHQEMRLKCLASARGFKAKRHGLMLSKPYIIRQRGL